MIGISDSTRVKFYYHCGLLWMDRGNKIIILSSEAVQEFPINEHKIEEQKFREVDESCVKKIIFKYFSLHFINITISD